MDFDVFGYKYLDFRSHLHILGIDDGIMYRYTNGMKLITKVYEIIYFYTCSNLIKILKEIQHFFGNLPNK